ncbi:MAG: hypothetical protein HZB15_06770 [Actinobacteria bacterium]|nr:hypothetical protein [Actinomycetota bacterium]
MIDPDIARELGFDASDVAANQMGLLTPEQEEVLADVARATRRRRLLMVVVFLVLIVAAVAAALVGADTDVTPAMVAVVVALALVPVALVVVGARRVGRSLAAFERPFIRNVDGRPRWEPSVTNSVYLEVGDVRFVVFTEQARLFDPTRTYRAYYIDNGTGGTTILSIEVVD